MGIHVNQLQGKFREAAEAQLGGARKKGPPIIGKKLTMNKWEQAFANEVLELRLRAGEIRKYVFGRTRVMNGIGAWYTPDFKLLMADRSIEFVEVKGHKREASIQKIKSAALIHEEHKFWFVCQVDGHWDYTLVGGE